MRKLAVAGGRHQIEEPTPSMWTLLASSLFSPRAEKRGGCGAMNQSHLRLSRGDRTDQRGAATRQACQRNGGMDAPPIPGGARDPKRAEFADSVHVLEERRRRADEEGRLDARRSQGILRDVRQLRRRALDVVSLRLGADEDHRAGAPLHSPRYAARSMTRSAGRITRTTVPCPGSLSISRVPPCSSTRRFTSGRPRPAPS
jgi:hypothetical protein